MLLWILTVVLFLVQNLLSCTGKPTIPSPMLTKSGECSATQVRLRLLAIRSAKSAIEIGWMNEELFHHSDCRNEEMWVKKSMPLSSYMGFVESFSSYQALLKEDPEKADRLSQDIRQRYSDSILTTHRTATCLFASDMIMKSADLAPAHVNEPRCDAADALSERCN